MTHYNASLGGLLLVSRHQSRFVNSTAAKKLDRLLRTYARKHADRVVEQLRPTNGRFSGFHQWADGRPALGAYLVSGGPSASRLWLALVDWRESENMYLVLFPESRSGPVAEIHRTSELPEGDALHWKYSPSLRDGKNEQRRAYFDRAFGSCDVFIRLPNTIEEVEDFCDDLASLAFCRAAADALTQESLPTDTFPEGRLVERLHLERERSPALIRRAKEHALAQGRPLRCACCDFDFEAKYGELGRGFIEAHHTKPVSSLHQEGEETRIEDIALVCPNCHRMLHRRRPWLGLHELRHLVK